MEAEVYRDEDWPHGLRCGACHRLFTDGQPISERLDAMTETDAGPTPMVVITCVGCAVEWRAISASPGEGQDDG